MRTLITLLIPGGPIVLAALAILRPGVLPDSAEPYIRAFPVVAALLPLNLALFASLPERGLLTARGMARLLLIPGQLLAAMLAVRIDPRSLGGWLDHRIAEARLTAWTDVPQVPLAAFAGTFVLLAVRTIRRRSPIEAGFF